VTAANRLLTEAEAAHFLDHHYIVLADCFPPETAGAWVARALERIGVDAQRPETFPAPFQFLPAERWVDARAFAPRVWNACCDLLGGEERIDDPYLWHDGFVANFGIGADKPWDPPNETHGSWHIDGDFNHFLDSPEQALLVIAIWKDIGPRGGGTVIAADSIGPVARKMLAHPQGLGANGFKQGLNAECREFVHLTGPAGTVYILHPYMLHTTCQNLSGTPRLISNTIVMLKEPMRFDRAKPEKFSLVERATLRALGVRRLEFQAPPEEWRYLTDHDTDRPLPGPTRPTRAQRLARMTG